MSDIHGTSDVPPRRTCGTMQVFNSLIERHPEYRTAIASLESATRQRFTEAAFLAVPETVTIPVVVHVVHNTDEENISQAQIDSQIEALNRDFRATNPDKTNTPPVWLGMVTDTNIQ